MRFAGAVSLLALCAGTSAYAQDGATATDKDQVIRELQQKLNALEARVNGLEAPAPAGSADLQDRLDGAVRESSATALREPTRLNLSAPGLDHLSLGGGIHLRGDYWGNFDAGNGNNDVSSFGTEAWLDFMGKVSETTAVNFTLHYNDIWGRSTSHGLDGTGGSSRLTGGSTGTPGSGGGSNSVDVSTANLNMRDAFGTGWGFTAGRQRIEFGDERIIGDDPWRMSRTSFDGIRLDNEFNSTSGLSFIAVRLEDMDNAFGSVLMPTDVDSRNNADLFGLYFRACDCEDCEIDAYVFHLEDPNYSDNGIEGRTRLTTYGARWSSGSMGGLRFDAEGATQFGQYFGERYKNFGFGTYAVHLEAAYDVRDTIEVIDSFYVGYDYATGGDELRENFVQLYPTLHGRFGLTDLFSWSNIKQTFLGFRLPLGGGLLDTSWRWNCLASDDAGFTGYTMGSRSPSGNVSKSLGQELDLAYSVECTKTTNVFAGIAYFLPGDGFADLVGAGQDDIVYGYVGLRTTF